MGKEKTFDQKFRSEVTRLKKIFGLTEASQSTPAYDPKQLEILSGQIERAAFMRVKLAELESDIAEKGTTEMFTQSEKLPPYERKRPTVDVYTALQKNYTATVKQLNDLLKKSSASTSPANHNTDGFDEFVDDR